MLLKSHFLSVIKWTEVKAWRIMLFIFYCNFFVCIVQNVTVLVYSRVKQTKCPFKYTHMCFPALHMNKNKIFWSTTTHDSLFLFLFFATFYFFLYIWNLFTVECKTEITFFLKLMLLKSHFFLLNQMKWNR